MSKLGWVVLVVLCCGTVTVEAAEESGPGLVELRELQSVQRAVAEAKEALGKISKDSPNYKDAVGMVGLKEAQLRAVQEKTRPVLKGIVDSMPVEDTSISKGKCYMERPLFGDLQFLGIAFQNWSVGTAVSTQLVRYNFSTKKTSLNTNVGAGISFRYFGDSPLGDEQALTSLGFSDGDKAKMKKRTDGNGNVETYSLPVYRIKPECRAATSDIGKERKSKLASSILSITPTLYASKQENAADLSVQPAILVGFLDDLVNIGTGFNLSGPETGKMFLVFSLGYGFQF